MFLAEAAEQTGQFSGFDVFVIAFTILLIIAFVRLVTAKQKNKFAIGFCFVSLAVFLFLDVLLVQTWMGKL